MEKRTLEQIEQEIAETKAALQDVHGTETEVYARIVGYYRAVKHWNKGKRDEFAQRKMFTFDSAQAYDITEDSKSSVHSEPVKETKTATVAKIEKAPAANSDTVTFEMYTRKTCPNCPSVKNYMSELDLPGQAIDVDTEDGLAQAARKGVCATPTVIFYNAAGVETARCHNVEELELVLNKVAVIA